jgi:hypothetical protein
LKIPLDFPSTFATDINQYFKKMKKLILVCAAAAFISVNAFSQNAKDLPAQVKTAFEKKFPGAQKVKWGAENKTEWEAEFVLNGKEYSANYNSDGTWMETEYEISVSEIPAAISATLTREFPGYKLGETEISETTKGKLYEFEVKTGKTEMEVVLKADGTLVKKEIKKEEKGKEDKD